MNERIRELAEHCDFYVGNEHHDKSHEEQQRLWVERFAQLIAQECANICMEMYAKCAGLPGDGALAKDCAYWIKKDFGVEE